MDWNKIVLLLEAHKALGGHPLLKPLADEAMRLLLETNDKFVEGQKPKPVSKPAPMIFEPAKEPEPVAERRI